MNNENKTQETMTMATDIIGTLGKQLDRFEKLAKYAIIAVTVIFIGLLAVNYRHAIAYETVNKQWLAYLTQYDFVAQDGDGYNYFNSSITGDVVNGTEGK